MAKQIKSVRPAGFEPEESPQLSRREAEKLRTLLRRQARQAKYAVHTA